MQTIDIVPAVREFDPIPLRAQFPALAQTFHGQPAVFFDNPGGTQVPERVIEATTRYYREANANVGGAFFTSKRTDAVLANARESMAALLNATGTENLVFGANMTTLTFHVARSFGETLRSGDEIVLTELDHDANVTPWAELEAVGATIRYADILPDGTIDMAHLSSLLNERTRLVAVTHASNAIGTIPDVAEIVRRAHGVGARVYVDAVQFAPHGAIDVQALDCDFLACSAYKFFGPHLGVVYGKTDAWNALKPHKVRPAKNTLPYCWETGTQNHEGMAATAAAVSYLADIGEQFGAGFREHYATQGFSAVRLTLKTAMAAIRYYEQTLSDALLSALQSIEGIEIYGLTDHKRLAERVPTVAFTWDRMPPRQTAEYLGQAGICCWSGNYYALRLMERLGLEATGGAVRIGLAHYNTLAEIERLREVLANAPKVV